MILSILAGMMIGLGAIIYLSVGETAGAFMFSLGLLTILHFKFSLFTGKAGKLSTKAISVTELGIIYVGNAFGTGLMGLIVHAVSRF
jgi:formate/nitrite transporter FocA (FNT family)